MLNFNSISTPPQMCILCRGQDTLSGRCGHIGNLSEHVAWCIAAKVSCFKMDWVVSLALLCEVFVIG